MAGFGLAVIRDLAAFLRDAKADDAGTPNPLVDDLQYNEKGNEVRLVKYFARAASQPAGEGACN